MVILVDMDDTIEDLLGAWVVALNKKTGQNVCKDHIMQWDISSYFPSLRRSELFSPLYHKEFWETVHPIPGAPEALKKLKTDGHTVLIVTASHYLTIAHKIEAVLNRYFPFIGWEDIIITSHKSLVHGDIMIDDGVHNFSGAESCIKLLFDQPHNRGFDESTIGAIRVKSWAEIYQVITYKTYDSSEHKEECQ